MIEDRPLSVPWHREDAVGAVNRVPFAIVADLERASTEPDENYSGVAVHPSVQYSLEQQGTLVEREKVRPEVSNTEVEFVTILQPKGDRHRKAVLGREGPKHFDWSVRFHVVAEPMLFGEPSE